MNNYENGFEAFKERRASNSKVKKVALVVGVPITILFIYLSLILSGERWNQSEIEIKKQASSTALRSADRILNSLESPIDSKISKQSEIKLEALLVEAGDQLEQAHIIESNSPKVFWANAIDVIFSEDHQECVQRSQILEAKGLTAYMKCLNDNYFREIEIAWLSGRRVDDLVGKFRPVADRIIRLFQLQKKAGASLGDIIQGSNFVKFSNSLGLADRAVAEQIDSLRSNTILSEKFSRERTEHMVLIHAEIQVREMFKLDN